MLTEEDFFLQKKDHFPRRKSAFNIVIRSLCREVRIVIFVYVMAVLEIPFVYYLASHLEPKKKKDSVVRLAISLEGGDVGRTFLTILSLFLYRMSCPLKYDISF